MVFFRFKSDWQLFAAKVISGSIACALAFGPFVNAQTPSIVWTTAIQKPPSVNGLLDSILHVGSGDTLVAGVDSGPFVARIDSNGNSVWKANLGFPGYRVTSLSTDATGLIAALNFSDTATFLKRVDNAGALQWDRSIFSETGSTILADPEGNHLVVSNTRFAPIAFAIRKISPDGQDVWATTITSPSKSRFDFPRGRFVGADGGIVVTGTTPNRDYVCSTGVCEIRHEMQTVRLDKNGNVLWTSLVGRGVGFDYVGTAVTIRPDGVAVVVGTARENGTLRVIAVGLDNSGQEIWRWRTLVIDSPYNPNVRVIADSQNNVLLAYRFSEVSPESSRMVKLSANGDTKFETVLPGLLTYADLQMDATGSTYVVTSSPVDSQNSSYRVFRVAADGSQIWQIAASLSNSGTLAGGSGPPFSIGGVTLNAINETQLTVQRIDQTGFLPLALGRVVSRRSHGAAGSFDIELDRFAALNGAPTIEPRKSLAGDAIVFQFNQSIAAPGGAAGTYAGGVGMPLNAIASGNEIQVEIPVLLEGEKFEVTLSNPGGGGPTSATIAQLVCEVSGNRAVGQEDAIAIKAQSGQSPRNGAARFDVNRTGIVSAAEIAACKSRLGRTL